MCLAIPGKVIKNDKGKLTIAYEGGAIRQAMAGDFQVSPDEIVLVQMGVVVRKMSNKEYEKVMEAWGETVTKLSDHPLGA